MKTTPTGVTLSFEIADSIALASLIDLRNNLTESIQKSTELCNGNFMALPEHKQQDYLRESTVKNAMDVVIDYYGHPSD